MQSLSEYIKRMQKLAGIPEAYAVEIIFQPNNPDLIVEHKTFQKFKKGQNRYTYHPKDENIPVKAHYHIYPSNSKKEIYAVNVDGTAHHKSNRGFQVPKKEAAELKKLGVTIPNNRILENKEIFLNESTENLSSIFLMIK